jgi:hypothetical protein
MTIPNAHVIPTDCPPDIGIGLCCRLRRAMDVFLSTPVPWFFRAIDDRWFNPQELYVYVQQLNSLLDPQRHVGSGRFAHIQGGTPVLMSRGAIAHMFRQFPGVCLAAPYRADDNAITLILNMIFQSLSAWADWRFAGHVVPGQARDWFMNDWEMYHLSGFEGLQRRCRSGARYLKPWRAIVGAHTHGCLVQWMEAVERAHESSVPENLMVEWVAEEGYVFCKGDSGVRRRMTSLWYLKAVTPKIEIDDPVLQYSCADVARLATQQCPFWWVNCSTLPDYLRQMGQMRGCRIE